MFEIMISRRLSVTIAGSLAVICLAAVLLARFLSSDAATTGSDLPTQLSGVGVAKDDPVESANVADPLSLEEADPSILQFAQRELERDIGRSALDAQLANLEDLVRYNWPHGIEYETVRRLHSEEDLPRL